MLRIALVMDQTSPGADTVIILARDQASFYEFVKPRQEAANRTLVILDRRDGERRKDGHGPTSPDRRRTDRRQGQPEAALALMSVLGFMILHRDGGRWVP
jgi:hypothetical protein